MKFSTTIQEINIDQWEDLTKKSKHASFFQTKKYVDFLHSCDFLETFIYSISEENQLKGLICGYIQKDGNSIKKYFSKRAIILGGVLLDESISKEALQNLLQNCIKQLKKKVIFIEIRNNSSYEDYKLIFNHSGFNYNPHLNFHVDCTSLESMKKKMGSGKLRDIKYCEKGGVEIIEATNQNEINTYYQILDNLYKTKVKTPLFPEVFFQNFVQYKCGKLFLLKYNNKIIGGTVCPILDNKIIYEWFACGIDGEYKNIYASTFATWAPMKFAVEDNIPLYDMMGAGKPNETYGVRDFKSKFGGELVEHGRFLYVSNPLFYYLGKKVIQVLKKLK